MAETTCYGNTKVLYPGSSLVCRLELGAFGPKESLEMVQEGLEATLFAIMEGRGFGADYMERYKMVSNFFQQRRPLIVLICGIPCSGNPACSPFKPLFGSLPASCPAGPFCLWNGSGW